jgi:hypothetical protein
MGIHSYRLSNISPNTTNSQSPSENERKGHQLLRVLYINNPVTPPISLATHGSTLSHPTPPVVDHPSRVKCCMHAFTKNSNQICLKVRNAILRSSPHTFLYIRVILKAKSQRGRTKIVGTALHLYIRKSPKDGIAILNFIYGQFYNGKLAYRYKLPPTDACPLCGFPDSCTHIAGELKSHNNNFLCSLPTSARCH